MVRDNGEESPRSRGALISEREKISHRTKAGLERARAMGKHLGRPKFSNGDVERLRSALDTGESWYAVSRKTRLPYSMVKKHARPLGYEPQQHILNNSKR